MLTRRITATDHSAVLRLAQASDTALEAAELTRDCARVWVATDASQAVRGFLLAWAVADEVHLLNIVSAPEVRRRGVGRALMQTLLEFAAETKARLVVLEVRRSNVAAIRLYRSSGFCAIGVRRGYYSDSGEDAVEMLATLDPVSGEIEPGRDEIHLSL